MSDNRRDQLIEFVEREFIGPDPIDWPDMTQSNGEEILTSDPPRIRYIAGILSKLLNETYMMSFSTKWYVLFFYVLNLIMVGTDLCLYIRNYRLERKHESENNP